MAKCILLTIKGAEQLVKILKKKRPHLVKEVERAIKVCKKSGYKYVPTCHNYDKKTGECLGHDGWKEAIYISESMAHFL